MIGRLIEHGRERHAPPDGQLLRYANGRPVTSRRYDHLWTRLGRHLPWVRTQQVSTHWIRHDPDQLAELRVRRRALLRRPHRQRQRGRRHRDLRPRQPRRSRRRAGRSHRRVPPARHNGRVVTSMVAVTIDASLAADRGPGGPVTARTAGPAADRSPAAARPGRTVRSWPPRTSPLRAARRSCPVNWDRAQSHRTGIPFAAKAADSQVTSAAPPRS